MKENKTKSVLRMVLLFSIIIAVTYGFLAFFNWNFQFSEWNGFSRFIIGVEGILFLLSVMNEL